MIASMVVANLDPPPISVLKRNTMSLRNFLLAACAACAIPTAVWAGGGSATVTVVHGINGTDLGLDEALPIDVNANGANVLAGVTFRSFSGPLILPAGTNEIAISLANPGTPGANAPFKTLSVDLSDGLDYSLLAHLDLNGDETATLFFNDLSALAGRNAFRQSVRHGAVAPTIDVIWYPERSGSAPLGVIDVSNSEEGGPADFGVSPLYSKYNREVQDAATSEVLLGPTPVRPVRRTYYYLYLVGSAANGTLETLEETRRPGR
jgi:hypothetical protein